MNYDEWKLDNPYNDEEEHIKEDIFLNGHLLQFINDSFYCNGGKMELSEMIETIDWIDNLLTHDNGFKKAKFDAFNMSVSMIAFRQKYMEFYNRGEL